MLRTGIIALAAAYIVIAPAHAEQDAIKSASSSRGRISLERDPPAGEGSDK